MTDVTSDEVEFVDNIIPLFSSNILTQGKFTLPNGSDLICFTRTKRNTAFAVGDNLFVDDVWPGSRVLADFLIENCNSFVGKSCLELGSGGALPSLVAASLGARRVVITDYPAEGVIENILNVISANALTNAVAVGHIWGTENVLSLLNLGDISATDEQEGYEVIFLAELLWKDTYPLHRNLLESLSACLNRQKGVAYITVAHRPTSTLINHSAENDMEFFSVAFSEFGLQNQLLQTSSKYHDVDETVPINVNLYSLNFVS
jgi:predicted nicotinamide N-methyase